MKPFILLGLCAALSLTACNKEIFMDTENRKPGYGSDGLPYADEAAEVKVNPNRKEHYQMVIKIKDAPLTFQQVRGHELYQSKNCKYTTSRFAGAATFLQFDVLLNFIKVDNETYVTDFYTDSPLNEDHYGQGVCEWDLISTSIIMEPTGTDPRETRLIARIRQDDLAKISPENPEIKIKHEYRKKDYPIMSFIEADDTGMPDSGIRNRGFLEPQDIFSVELTVRKAEQ